MRVVFIDLHINCNYVWTIGRILAKQRAICKRRHILDYIMAQGDEILNLITPNGSDLPRMIRSRMHSDRFRIWEAEFVFKKNGIPAKRIKNIVDPSEIKDDDIVFYHDFYLQEQFVNASEVHGIKIVDQIHFYGNKEQAELLKRIGCKYYTYDVDLNKYCKQYQKNYAWFRGEYIMLPLTYQERFCVKKPFSERMKKAVAVGTLTKFPKLPEFAETYGTEYYQPHRKMIMDEASKYPEALDSFISEYQEKPLKEIHEGDSKVVKLYKLTVNFFTSGKQKKYFSFDMVEKYNDYKMFICPEDMNGSYGIGTIEGMACGCAMIGWNYGAFEDMGMKAGVHYISYDGTMENLVERIQFYQRPENQAELERIAKEGCKFIRENFSEKTVAENFYKKLQQIAQMNSD